MRFLSAHSLKFLTVICLPVLASVAGAEDKDQLFSSHDALEIELKAPWRDVVRKKDDTRWPAVLLLTDSDGQSQEIELTVERRGVSRQKVCEFPPIRLRFKKKAVKDTIFEDEGSLKVVTHCDKGSRWTQYNVREMLAYRVYNLLTDQSFRVRPLNVRYTDTERDQTTEPQFGFVIEDIDEVADRFQMVELELQSTRPDRLDSEKAALMALYQFMIGNLDWSPVTGPDGCCHNAKLIGSEDLQPPYIPLPYDFDASGIVDAHYAVPPAQLRVRSVTTRMYRGYCQHNDSLAAARATMLDQEENIETLVENETRLNSRSQKKMLDYLGDFFEILKDDQAFEKEIVSVCRG